MSVPNSMAIHSIVICTNVWDQNTKAFFYWIHKSLWTWSDGLLTRCFVCLRGTALNVATQQECLLLQVMGSLCKWQDRGSVSFQENIGMQRDAVGSPYVSENAAETLLESHKSVEHTLNMPHSRHYVVHLWKETKRFRCVSNLTSMFLRL